jgi:hypothetical protein
VQAADLKTPPVSGAFFCAFTSLKRDRIAIGNPAGAGPFPTEQVKRTTSSLNALLDGEGIYKQLDLIFALRSRR